MAVKYKGQTSGSSSGSSPVLGGREAGAGKDVAALTYREALEKLLLAYEGARLLGYEKTRSALAVLIIQLVNGCLISEAIEAFRKFSETGERRVNVDVKMRRVDVSRTVIIPDFIEKGRLPSRGAVLYWARRLGFINTRNLFYAFIRENLGQGLTLKDVTVTLGRARIRKLAEELKAENMLASLKAEGKAEGPKAGGAPQSRLQWEWDRLMVHVPKTLRSKLEEKAREMGFSSANELVRSLIYDFFYYEEEGLRSKLEEKAREMGFSSANELVRSLIYDFLSKEREKGEDRGREK